MLSFSSACVAVAAVNVLAVLLMVYDKRAASRRGWRVPESSFFLLALLGGSPAVCIMMRRLRHKTKKKAFRYPIAAIVLMQLMVLTAVAWFYAA